MYSNNFNYSTSSSNSMMPNYYNQRTTSNIPMSTNQDDRFVGGFLGPFILGGITGGLVAPAFYNNRPCCSYPAPYGPYGAPYPYYGPYYR